VRGYRAQHLGDAVTYLAETQKAIALFREAGDERTACSLNAAVGYAELSLGLLEEAERDLSGVLALAARLGLGTVVTLAKHNLGLVLARKGQVGEGLRLEREAVEESVAQHDKRIESGARVYLAVIEAMAGNFTVAEEQARRSHEVSAPPGRSYARAVLADVLLSQGRVREALEASREAAEILESLGGGIEEGEALVRLIRAEALIASGALYDGLVHLASARERLVQRAERIREPRWRAAFLDEIPEHARTLARAKELCDV
jgi:tetratricopeptide (TPR) repeat protein